MTGSSDLSTLDIHKISDDGRTVRIIPDDAQRAEIAERLELEGLTMLEADLRVVRDGPADSPRTGIFIEGDLKATGTQTCVVSLQPVPFEISTPFEGIALPADSSEFEREELTLEDDEVELLGEITDSRVDLSEIVVQQLALELDPFPRAEGAEPEWQNDQDDEAEVQAESPFAALAKLKETLK